MNPAKSWELPCSHLSQAEAGIGTSRSQPDAEIGLIQKLECEHRVAVPDYTGGNAGYLCLHLDGTKAVTCVYST